MQSKLRRKKEGILRSETEGNSTYAGKIYLYRINPRKKCIAAWTDFAKAT
jgi:hypothetical protein